MRAAQMESLCKQRGGDRDAQDLAFMVGVFSLLDVLLGIPMTEIVDELKLPPDTAAALTERSGTLGQLLALVESPAPTGRRLARSGHHDTALVAQPAARLPLGDPGQPELIDARAPGLRLHHQQQRPVRRGAAVARQGAA